MRQISGKQLAAMLERRGWRLLRSKGSHHIYGMPGRVERISVPLHGNQPLKVGLLRHLLKIAGLNESELD
jgi:predicted RNA binding protein YcfA (HicA-like mRNA interferase family)